VSLLILSVVNAFIDFGKCDYELALEAMPRAAQDTCHCFQTPKAVIQYTCNSYTLQLNDKQETMIPLSKQSEKELQDLLGY
jgi:hypothetical protein